MICRGMCSVGLSALPLMFARHFICLHTPPRFTAPTSSAYLSGCTDTARPTFQVRALKGARVAPPHASTVPETDSGTALCYVGPRRFTCPSYGPGTLTLVRSPFRPASQQGSRQGKRPWHAPCPRGVRPLRLTARFAHLLRGHSSIRAFI